MLLTTSTERHGKSLHIAVGFLDELRNIRGVVFPTVALACLPYACSGTDSCLRLSHPSEKTGWPALYAGDHSWAPIGMLLGVLWDWGAGFPQKKVPFLASLHRHFCRKPRKVSA